MEVLESSLSGAPLLKIVGDVDHLTAPALDEAIQGVIGRDGSHLLLDLSECLYLDSGGLGVLLFTLRELRNKGWLGVIGSGPNLLRLFEIVGLAADPDFRIFPSLEDASLAVDN